MIVIPTELRGNKRKEKISQKDNASRTRVLIQTHHGGDQNPSDGVNDRDDGGVSFRGRRRHQRSVLSVHGLQGEALRWILIRNCLRIEGQILLQQHSVISL